MNDLEILEEVTPTSTPATVYVYGLDSLENDLNNLRSVQSEIKYDVQELNDRVYDGINEIIIIGFALVFFEAFRFVKGLFKEVN